MPVELVDQATVIRYLRDREILSPSETASASELTGGVSNRVWMVASDSRRVVVKQSLEKLLVDGDWFASRERTAVEAAAMKFVSALTPAVVPELLDFDSESLTLTMTGAPEHWVDWKTALFRGRVDRRLAASLGTTLGLWQAPSVAATLPPEVTGNASGFAQLRIEPYFVAAAQRRPDVEEQVYEVIDRLRNTSTVFVHGDFSPKNVLCGEGGSWVTDFEVANLGDPVFDVAFMASHLALKSFALAASRTALIRAMADFLHAFEATRSLDAVWLSRELGALMTARVDGKSKVDYLDEAARYRVVAASRSLLLDPPGDIDGLFDRLDQYHDAQL